jgi:hypothetical protein
MVSSSEVSLLLHGWADAGRRLRVIAREGIFDFSAYCLVRDVNEAGVTLQIGEDSLNLISLDFRDFFFEFTDAPPDDDKLGVPGRIESGVLGLRGERSIWFFLLRE